MNPPVIVVHYHELWLKGRNRRFFLRKLALGLREGLGGLPIERIEQPGDRFVVRMTEGADVSVAIERLQRILGIVYYAVARSVDRDMDAICRAAWDEVRELEFSNFAVRAKRSDKRFPHGVMDIERAVGRYLLDKFQETGRSVRVKLDDPEVTCRVEIPPGPALVYARKIPGTGGLPANTGGRMMCLLSGGYDSAVAAYLMMKRGAHLSFIHFYSGGGSSGESSAHVAQELARVLASYQLTAKLWRIPFESIQRQIVANAPEGFRILLYRRMMLRIAEAIAHREHAIALATGDSLGQVASQTLQNMVSVGDAVRMPVFRPLAGTDKLEVLALARKIGTYEISSEKFHDCCPAFMPRTPELHATPKRISEAELNLNIGDLVRQGMTAATVERFRYRNGAVQQVDSFTTPRKSSMKPAICETASA